MPGHFVQREDVSRLTCNLGQLQERLQALAKAGEAERAVRLHEILLSGIYGKSKHYGAALEHFEKARDLYCGAGQAPEWEAAVAAVRMAHSRKSGFLSAFEQLVSGASGRSPSFVDEAHERWKRLGS